MRAGNLAAIALAFAAFQGAAFAQTNRVFVSSMITAGSGTLTMQGCTDISYQDQYTYSAEADVFPNGQTAGASYQVGGTGVCAFAYVSASANQSYWVQTNHWVIANSSDPAGFSGISAQYYEGSATLYATGRANGPGSYYVASTYNNFSTYGSPPSIAGVDQTTYGPPRPGQSGYVILYGSNLAATWASPQVTVSIPGMNPSVAYASPGQVNVFYTVPAGACPGPVASSLTTPYGTAGFTFTITGSCASPQTISFPQPPNTSMGAGAFSVSATATSGLPVTFTSDTQSVCTVSGNSVTPVTAGSCTIRAHQGGNAQWQPAPDVTRTLTISASSLTITTSTLPPGAAGLPYSAPLAATGGTGGYTWTAVGLPSGLFIAGSTISGTPASSSGSPFTVTLSVQDSGGTTASKSLQLSIAAAREYIRLNSRMIGIQNQ